MAAVRNQRMNALRLPILCAIVAFAIDALGAPLFRSSWPLGLGSPVSGVTGQMVVADFNGDTKPDLAVPSWDGRLVVVVSDPTAPFGPIVTSTIPEYAFAMAAGDLDNDGDQDLVYRAQMKLGVLINNGSGAFTETSTVNTVANAYVAIGDVNGDGKQDAIAVSADTYSNAPHLSVHLGNGSGGLAAGVISPGAWSNMRATSVIAADLTGDGKAEVITGGDQVVVYAGLANGAMQANANAIGGTPAVGLLDSDSVPDLTIHRTNFETATLYTLKGVGHGQFAAPVAHWTPVTNAVSVTCADFDGDQVQDVIAVGSSVAVARGLGNGLLAAPKITIHTTGYYGGAAVVDLDRDGKRDLITSTQYERGARFLRGNGDGTFREDRAYAPRMPLAPTVGISAADINGDGRADATTLLTSSGAPSDIAVMLNDGSGGLAAATLTGTTVPLSASPNFIVGNLNGDAWPDALIVTHDSASSAAIAFLGNGSGTFTQAATSAITTDFDPYYPSLKLADVTGDGAADLLLEGDLYEGNGDGSFDAARHEVAEFRVIGDIDGNGTMDALWFENQTGSIAVALNTGGGHFAAPVFLAPGPSLTPYALGDFDGDGKLDLFCTVHDSFASSRVFGGNGDGTFRAPVEMLLPYSGPDELPSVVADFDGDGKLDVTIAAHVYLGNGDLRFRGMEYDAFVADTAVADFDANGSLDILAFSGGLAQVFLTKLTAEPTRDTATTITATPATQHGQISEYVSRTTGGAPLSGMVLYTDSTRPIALMMTNWNPPEQTAASVRSFALGVGAHTVEAKFLGDEVYRPSSGSLHVDVEKATTTLVYQPPSSGVYGTSFDVDYSLTAPVVRYLPAPSKTAYRVTEGGVTLPNVEWRNGDVLIDGLEAGSHTLTLQFLGDDHYKASSATFTRSVNKRSAYPSLSFLPDGASRVAGPVTITATLPVPEDYGTTTGSIEFRLGGQLLGTMPVTNHQASITTGHLNAGTYSVAVTYSGDANTLLGNGGQALQVFIPAGAPIPVQAGANANSVYLTWLPSSDAATYKVYEKLTFASAWQLRTTTQSSTTQVTLSVATGKTRMYAIAAGHSDSSIGPLGPPDLATTVPLTRWNLADAQIRATDVTQLRTGVNAVRTFAGLTAFPFTDPTLSGLSIRAVHFTELRDALAAARSAIGMPLTLSTAPQAGELIRASHLHEVRDGIY